MPTNFEGFLRRSARRKPIHWLGSPVRHLGIVIGPHTASAGEMLAVVLHGETGSQTFGEATYGATTSNVVYPLPDGATLLLTVYRYASGEQPPIKGPLLPDQAVPTGTDQDTAVSAAADWVGKQNAACRR